MIVTAEVPKTPKAMPYIRICTVWAGPNENQKPSKGLRSAKMSRTFGPANWQICWTGSLHVGLVRPVWLFRNLCNRLITWHTRTISFVKLLPMLNIVMRQRARVSSKLPHGKLIRSTRLWVIRAGLCWNNHLKLTCDWGRQKITNCVKGRRAWHVAIC